MSRLKRLKDRRRKNKIKTTYCCLTLALAMGISQGIGTYALFTDNENVPSDISLSTGDVDVEVNPVGDFTDTELNLSNYIEMPIKITNNGTLNQNIRLSLSTSEDIEFLIHTFEFDGITVDNGVLYDSKGLFKLEPGDSISGKTIITLNNGINENTQDGLAGKEIEVYVTVKATQINPAETIDSSNPLIESGFYDIATQTNTIVVAQRKIITISTGTAYFTGGNKGSFKGNEFEKLYIPINFSGTGKEEIILQPTLPDDEKYKAEIDYYEYVDEGGKKYQYYIVIQNKTEGKPIVLPQADPIDIDIKVTVGDDEYILYCTVTPSNAGNNCSNPNHPDHGTGGKNKCQPVAVTPRNTTRLKEENESEEVEESINLEILEPSKEETSELERVEQPKEELEESSELEVIEPSEEEMLEIQKQPEVIELLRETEDLQE